MRQVLGADGVWIGRVQERAESVAQGLDAGLMAVNGVPSRGTRWAVKVNLAYPRYLPGVVNSPTFLAGLCRWAADRGVGLVFVEGDGGNGSYRAEDAFDGNGLTRLAREYGIRCVSLSQEPWEWRETEVQGRLIHLPYAPFFRQREFDQFVTTPLFKNHVFTVVSLGMKNLWGCIPDPYRMYYHHVLNEGIVALCKELQPDLSIFDGIVGLRGRGPLDGHPVSMNAVMTTRAVGAGEAAALEIMGVRLSDVRHLQIAHAEGLMPLPSAVSWQADPRSFRRTDFIVERSWLNRFSMLVAKFPVVQRVVYHSALSSGLYRVANRLRGDSPQARLSRATPRKIFRGARSEER
jgi:uncharacterized protein (DUF362 family)